MNTSILKKCLEELSKPTPDISYVRGMLETLSEMSVNEGVNRTRDLPLMNTSDSDRNYFREFPPVGKMVTADSPEGMAVEAALAGLQGMPTPKVGTLEKNIILN